MVEVTVFDVTGRLVRRLESGFFAGGIRILTWDGLDENGTPVGTGTYFARLFTDSGVHATERFTIVR